MSAEGDGDGSRKADVGLMLPVVLGPAPVEGICARLVIPFSWPSSVGYDGGKDAVKAQKLPVNSARGRHGTGQ